MRQALLDILVCPETRQPVHLAETTLLNRLNRRIGQGRLANRGGTSITTPLGAALVREDRRCCYPIRADIPVMLIDEAIPLSDL